ncbi:MAG: FAD-dependent oxidoreductase, partial [Thermoguttaceae bacterium]
MRNIILPLIFCLAFGTVADTCSAASHPEFPDKETEWDVVIYGGISGSVTAAVQAKKMGKSVVIISPDKHIGGMSSGGLGFTDSGKTATIGGLSREFYQRIYEQYQKPENWNWEKKDEFTSHNIGQGTSSMRDKDRTMWTFEPSAAEKTFNEWLVEYDIPVYTEEKLDRENGVKKEGSKIKSIKTLSGKKFTGKMFIDTTYEGDLMAAAKVAYTVGREPSAKYDEKWNGIQIGAYHHGHWFKTNISAYKVFGKPESGLLPFISPEPPGKTGDGDHRVQAYCFRMCLTDNTENQVPFFKPEGYDPADYELLKRVLASGWREAFEKFDMIPNRKTDTNNHGPFSTDFIGMNYDYPDGSYDLREDIIEKHRKY